MSVSARPSPIRAFIGFDAREIDAYVVASTSLKRHSSVPLDVTALKLADLQKDGLYTRPTRVMPDGALYDELSEVEMSTEFSLSRFLVPYLANFEGWALFCDADFLWRRDVADLWALRDPRYAVMCVKRIYDPQGAVKMDGRIQKRYPRKNWSSLALWNCGHEANRALVPEMVNALPYRALHGFAWLQAHMIGPLPEVWNWIEQEPAAVHFSEGVPSFSGYENAQYADEWRSYLINK